MGQTGVPRSGTAERIGDDLPRLGNDRLQVVLAEKALCVDLEDVLRARRAGSEPSVVRDDLEAADLGAVSGSARQSGANGLPTEGARTDGFGRQFLEDRFLLGRGWRVDSRVNTVPYG